MVRDQDLDIVVEDNGVGLPQGFDWTKSESLGIRLVNSLTEQLNGTIKIDSAAGTRYRIAVPLRD